MGDDLCLFIAEIIYKNRWITDSLNVNIEIQRALALMISMCMAFALLNHNMVTQRAGIFMPPTQNISVSSIHETDPTNGAEEWPLLTTVETVNFE